MSNPLFNISYGLYVITVSDDGRDCGCIINTAQLVTTDPKRMTIAINKDNYTHDLVEETKVFNLNCLTVETPFKVFENFGFQSGRDVDKFANCESEPCYSANGLRYLPKYANSYISGKVVASIDFGTHTMFIADVTDAVELSQKDSLTYDYYQKNIKPKPKVEKSQGGTKWVCKVCGYVYEGEELPSDFICPWCKHGAEDFEKIEEEKGEKIMELKGSKTEKNLEAAFAGESMARNKYTYYASKAKKDGYVQIAQLFEETANQEKEHAKIWFKLLNGGIDSTEKNLASAAEGENYEWVEMYPEFAKVAKEEGFDEIAKLFEEVAAIEKVHEDRYKKLLENVTDGIVFSRDNDVIWQCKNCGHIVIGKKAPEVCPVCNHPQAYFEIKAENY
ncbi:MAG: rubrerythrin [Ruminococcus sp.]